jgi:hypothetical protein
MDDIISTTERMVALQSQEMFDSFPSRENETRADISPDKCFCYALEG